jgi:hypothetical protein
MSRYYLNPKLDFDLETDDLPVGCINSHFLDSGSFTLWTRAAEYAKENHCENKWAFYDTPEFWEYADSYAAFVKEYADAVDHYANVDVIPNPKLSWRNQEYLENKHGLTPVPVVHYTTDLKWLKFYMERGHEFIALGGLVGGSQADGRWDWIDRAFDIVCDQPSRLPKVKIHGFGVTNWDLLLRYPWYSVDSTSWTKAGAYGGVFVPHKRGGKFVFTEQPYVIKTSFESPETKDVGKHYFNLTAAEKTVVDEWLELIRVPLGTLGPPTGEGGRYRKEDVLTYGVITRHTERRAANLIFFEMLRDHIPQYPWPFRSTAPRGFGIL